VAVRVVVQTVALAPVHLMKTLQRVKKGGRTFSRLKGARYSIEAARRLQTILA